MQTLEIIKIGGKVIDVGMALRKVLRAVAQLPQPKILVHGGGSMASTLAGLLGITPVMVAGRRVTDAAMLDVATMVYAGKINKNVVAALQAHGCNALGLCGADAAIIRAVKRPVGDIDYGFVGDIEQVNVDTLSAFLELGLTPVFSAITYQRDGLLLNTNADTLAATLAASLAGQYAVHLTFVFEKAGVLDAKGKLITRLDKATFTRLKQEKVIADGMIPKLDNAFAALAAGVQTVRLASDIYLLNNKLPCTTLIATP